MIQGSTSVPAHPEPREHPVRTCVGCRRRALNSELLRVVAADGRLVVDTRGRLGGRGAWLHPDLECLAAAQRRRAFPRALRVSGPLDVDGLDEYLRGRLIRTSE
ncbi:MAG: YlxR family protein [Haloechinothrix sp.]